MQMGLSSRLIQIQGETPVYTKSPVKAMLNKNALISGQTSEASVLSVVCVYRITWWLLGELMIFPTAGVRIRTLRNICRTPKGVIGFRYTDQNSLNPIHQIGTCLRSRFAWTTKPCLKSKKREGQSLVQVADIRCSTQRSFETKEVDK